MPHRLVYAFVPLAFVLSTLSGWAQTEPIAASPFTVAPVALWPATESQASMENGDVSKPDSFSDLFRHIGGDFRSLPQRDNLLLLSIGAGLSAATHPGDRTVSHSLSRPGTVEEALDSGNVIGGAMVQLGAPLLLYGLGRAFDDSALAHVGGELFRAQVLAQGVTQGIKYAVQRTRPDGTGLSFPSGHAASSFATATVLQRDFGWKVGIPAYGVATYVAASRISENRHYLSDVIFGATIGLVAGRTVTLGHGNTRFAISPTVVGGGVGISFVQLPSK